MPIIESITHKILFGGLYESFGLDFMRIRHCNSRGIRFVRLNYFDVDNWFLRVSRSGSWSNLWRYVSKALAETKYQQ